MDPWAYVAATPLLAAIFVEDWRHRAIRWVWPALLGVGGLAYGFWAVDGFLDQLATGLFLLASILVVFFLYMFLRKRSWKEVTTQQLGTGDLVMLPLLAVLCVPEMLLLCLIASTVIGILGWLVFRSFRLRGIPLAGILAAVIWLHLTQRFVSSTWNVNAIL